MSSQSRHENARQCVNIPVICLNSLAESSDRGCHEAKLDTDFLSSEEHIFGVNDSNVLSWLSYLSASRKFMIAAVLLSQCDEGYRRAMWMLLRRNSDRNFKGISEINMKANSEEYLEKLQSEMVLNQSTLDHVKELISNFGLTSNFNQSHPSARRSSTSSVSESKGEGDIGKSSSHNCDSVANSESTNSNESTWDDSHLKSLYLGLVSRILDTATILDVEDMTLDDSSLNEMLVQTQVGQIFLTVLLHPSFTDDDRRWFLSVMRSRYSSSSGNTTSSVDGVFRARLVRCLLDIGSDIAHAMHCTNLGPEQFAPSISPSLTSSGFLSGFGGSDSQYDLFPDMSNCTFTHLNPNNGTKSNYGTLLTVPTPEMKYFQTHNRTCCLCSLNAHGHLAQRRLSDIPLSSNMKCYHAPNMIQPINPNEPKKDADNSASDCAFPTAPESCTFLSVKTPVTSRSCVPTSLSLSPTEPSTSEQDFIPAVSNQKRTSASTLSDTSSISSGNLEYGMCRSHSPIFTVKPSSASEPVATQEDIGSSHSSPSSILRSHLDELGSAIEQTPSPALSGSGVNTFQLDHPNPTGSKALMTCFDDTSVAYNCNRNFESVQDSGPLFNSSNNGNSNNNNNNLGNSDGHENPCHDKSSCWNNENLGFAFPMRNTFVEPLSGMGLVPVWLKSLRLHKYARLFQQLNYYEMISITEDWLEKQNVTQGARNKILLSIQKLKHRKFILAHAASCLVDSPTAESVSQGTIRVCLSEIKQILQTPFPPSIDLFSEVMEQHASNQALHPQSLKPMITTPDKLIQRMMDEHFCNKNLDVENNSISNNKSLNDLVDPNSGGMSGTYPSYYPDSNSEVRASNIPSCSNISSNDADDLPKEILNCLNKVCSHLLVSISPEVDSCDDFVQIAENILNNPSFSQKQKKLVASWKYRMLAVHGPFSNRQPSHYHKGRYHASRLVPRSNSRYGPGCFGSSKYIQARSANDKFNPTHLLPSSNSPCCPTINFPMHDTSHPNSNNLELSPESIPIGSTCAAVIDPLANDSYYRRHSVPVYQPQPPFPPLKLNQRRRMPSPNPPILQCPSDLSPNMEFSQSHQLHASSEYDLCGGYVPSQFSRPRFHSPSRFEPVHPSVSRRNLMPPATAPATRMPSPSDVGRQGVVCGEWGVSCSPSGMNNLSTAFPYFQSASFGIDDLGMCDPPSATSKTGGSMNVGFGSPAGPHSFGSEAPCSSMVNLSVPSFGTAGNMFIHPGEMNTQKAVTNGPIDVGSNMNPGFLTLPSNTSARSSIRSSKFSPPAPDQGPCVLRTNSPLFQSGFQMPLGQSLMNAHSIPEWFSGQYSQSYMGGSSPTQTSGDKVGDLDFSNDRINQDLDLLTREVTELAIAELDSPAD